MARGRFEITLVAKWARNFDGNKVHEELDGTWQELAGIWVPSSEGPTLNDRTGPQPRARALVPGFFYAFGEHVLLQR